MSQDLQAQVLNKDQDESHKGKSSKGANPNWWRGGILYQVYPRSYFDANGDGLGDLQGIREKLPYIASLGVDGVWISPFFKSPMKDFGYDVSDYCDIDPQFGTMVDFDALLETAHSLDLKIIIDLVLSHTSDQHGWFAESRATKSNPKANWYVWSDPKEDGTPPNNWLSIFGGSAWQWDSRRQQYYLHNFLTSQPDLNFHEPEVQEAVLGVTKFWLDRGVDGFRLDTINFYVHDAQLRSNPALPQHERNDNIAPLVNPYNHQKHLYSKNQPENLIFLERFRALLDQYEGRTCVGEVGDAQFGMELMGQYTQGNKRAHMCYAFEFLCAEKPTAARIVQVFAKVDEVAADGWPCWAFSNHDVIRHATRWALDDRALRAYLTLILCLRGTLCFYQGEELGLEEAEVAFEDLQDPYGIEFWPEFKGRDGCRTPMVWHAQAENAGFSEGIKPWLPIGQTHTRKAVDQQEADPGALLHAYRRGIAMRQANAVLRTGQQAHMRVEGPCLSFHRHDDQAHMFCAFNLSTEAAELSLAAGSWTGLEGSSSASFSRGVHSFEEGQRHSMAPWDVLVLQQEEG